jgi:hypothetical protein
MISLAGSAGVIAQWRDPGGQQDGRASAKSGCLYAVNRNGRIVSERGGAVIEPWSFTKTVIAAATSALVRDGALHLDNTRR